MAKPEKTFRVGVCSASVFLNTAGTADDEEPRTFRSVSLQRRYRDGEEWKSSTSFKFGDLPAAIAALNLAMNYVADKEAGQED